MTYTVVIAGVGPGLGESLARKFVAEGCSVGLFARSEDYLTDLEADLQTEGSDALAVPTDVTTPSRSRQASSECARSSTQSTCSSTMPAITFRVVSSTSNPKNSSGCGGSQPTAVCSARKRQFPTCSVALV